MQEDTTNPNAKRMNQICVYMDYAHLGMSVLNSDLEYIYFNKAWCKMTGFSSDEVHNVGLEGIVHAEYRKRIKDAYQRLLDGVVDHCDNELMFIRKDGTFFWGALTSSIVDDAGQEREILNILTDISEQKQSEMQLQFRNEFLQILIDSIPHPIFYSDIHGYLEGCNTAFEIDFNVDRNELAWTTLFDIMTEEVAKKFEVIDQQLIKAPGETSFEMQLVPQDGEIHDYIIKKATFEDINLSLDHVNINAVENRRIAGVISILVDISDRKKAERDLKESYEKLENAQEEIIQLERKTSAMAMAVTANHEINQPLMIIKGNLEMLQMVLDKASLDDHSVRFLTRINESVDRIQSILDRFKATSKIEFEAYTEGTTMIRLGEGVSEVENDDDPLSEEDMDESIDNLADLLSGLKKED